MYCAGSTGWIRQALSNASLVVLLAAAAPASVASVSSVTLAWDPSADPSVIGYKLYYGAASRSYTNLVQAAATNSASVTALVGGKTYYFAATAYDATGLESDYSDEVSYTVPVQNQPPTIDPIADVSINENAGLQTVNLTGITAGAGDAGQTLSVTATSSNPSLIANPAVNYTSPNNAGSLSFMPAAFGLGTATITVTVNDNQPANNTTNRSFTVTVNPLAARPAPFTNLFVLPNVALRFALYPPFTNGDKLSFTLASGAPAGATIQTKKGISSLTWKPSSAQSSTTNLIVIQVADNTQPALSTTEALLVIVLDYVDVSSDWTAIQAGQTCSIPIYLSSSDGVTNLALSMDWFPDRFSNPSVSSAGPGSGSASMQNQGTNLVVCLQAAAGKALQGSNLVAHINFQTLANQSSAFVYMPLEVLSATKPNGAPYANPVPDIERVVVVSDVPLAEANSLGNTNLSLTLYGTVGANYQLQSQTDLGAAEAWQPLLNYRQTNIQQAVTIDATQPRGFYRVLQQ